MGDVLQEHRLTVSRAARYFTRGALGTAREVWFVLHGYGQLAARFLKNFGVLDDGRRLLVAPEALSRFYVDPEGRTKVGASWMTREDRLAEIDDYVRFLDAVARDVLGGAPRPGTSVHVLGFSQGAATACRWVARGATKLDRLIVWGGELPPDLDLAPLRSIPVLFVYGREDAMITAKIAAAAERRLAESGIGHRMVPFDGGHELKNDVLTRLLAPSDP